MGDDPDIGKHGSILIIDCYSSFFLSYRAVGKPLAADGHKKKQTCLPAGRKVKASADLSLFRSFYKTELRPWVGSQPHLFLNYTQGSSWEPIGLRVRSPG
jgi:hypothetical protein